MADFNLSETLYKVINAAGRKDWSQVELRANELVDWARAARRVTEEGSNEFPDDGRKDVHPRDAGEIPDGVLDLLNLVRLLSEELVYRLQNKLNWERVLEISQTMEALAKKHI